MTWVKICGMTNLEDALVAVESGADAVGFVFYEKSPRCVSVETAREIVSKLPDGVEKVGVFVGDLGDALDVASRAGLTSLQSYPGANTKAEGIGHKLVRVSALPKRFRLLVSLPIGSFCEDEIRAEQTATDLANSGKALVEFSKLSQGVFDTFVLDSGNVRTPGGTGKTFDWEKAVPFAVAMRDGGLKLVVAGGLNSENVGEAIEILKPWGVDVASGVEAKPGKKDPKKVRAFVRAVREMDCRTR